MARVIPFISASKGVGKTSLCVSLAVHLGSLGQGTCIFNADSDAASVYNLMEIHPRYTLEDIIENRIRMDGLLLKGPAGIDFIPGYPGIERLGGLKPEVRDRLHRSFLELNRYDFFILDTFPGLSRNVVSFSKAAVEPILVMTTESRSLTDAYMLLKTLAANGFGGTVMVLINKSRDLHTARRAYSKFKEAVHRYLPISVFPLGTVFEDPQVSAAKTGRKPFVSLYPRSDAAQCISSIAGHLVAKKVEDLAVSAFFTEVIESMKHPYRIVAVSAGNFPESIAPHPDEDATFSVPAEAARSQSDPYPEAEHPGDPPALSDIRSTLETLSEGITRVSREMAEIKSALSHKEQPVPEQPAAAETVKIPLDFEAYLKMKTSNG